MLRNASPALQGSKEAAAFLGRVLDDEESVDAMPPRRPPLPGEGAFWWCIEQLLLLCDLARPPDDAYLLVLIDQLRTFADLVEQRRPLPPGYRLDWMGCDAGPNEAKMATVPQQRGQTTIRRAKMKLYDMKRAPNPRRVRMFMAEKGISCETVEIDIIKGENLSQEYLQINPRGVLPTLVLDDGTALDETVAICRYLEELHPEPPLMGTDPLSKARIEARQRHIEFDGMLGGVDAFRNSVPAFANRALAGNQGAVAAIPALVERGKAQVLRFYRRLDEDLGRCEFIAGDRFSIADITGLCVLDFCVGAARLPIPEGCANLRRWHKAAAARPSAKA